MNRRELLELAADLGITSEEAGEDEWAYYLSDRQLAAAINRLRPGADAVGSDDDDEEAAARRRLAADVAAEDAADAAAGITATERRGFGRHPQGCSCGDPDCPQLIAAYRGVAR